MGPSGFQYVLWGSSHRLLYPQHHWVTMVMMTSPFQVLFHLAETSIPTIGGGLVSMSSVQENLGCLAILYEMSKHIKIH